MRLLTSLLLKTVGIFTLLFSQNLYAHDFNGKAHYLANEGVVVESGKHKLMFDPFFHNDYGTYRLVPEKMRQAIFNNKAPYDNVSAIFISHAHGDHFDATDTIRYLTLNKTVRLFAPKQAVEQLKSIDGYDAVSPRITSVSLQKDEPAVAIPFGELLVEAVRIPHAGWPQRADIENIVFRVGGANQITVMHFGDADTDESHYQIHQQFWQSKLTDLSFVPFWFGLSESGKRLIESGINTEKAIGVHVPKVLPNDLKGIGFDYLHTPGETRTITRSLDKSQ